MSAASAERFGFGDNWRDFLRTVDDRRIAQAEASLVDYLASPRLDGQRVLDIGCGSGLFSLAARRLGATVHSFDHDAGSVTCAEELRRRYQPGDPSWTIERGSVLDPAYLAGVGQHDVVYSWGVLHHTGDLPRAMSNAADRVAPGGRLFIAIYNDQGLRSRLWARVKRLYNNLPRWARAPYVVAVMAPREVGAFLLGPGRYLRSWRDYHERRGMSRWHDLVDWVGGYPFEVATPALVTEFYESRGFALERLDRARGIGCNQFVFRRR